MTEADEFLKDVYRLGESDEEQAAGDRVFFHFDQLLHEGKFEQCDAILRDVDVERLSTSLMRGFLAITYAAKNHLPARGPLLDVIREAMTKRRGREIADRLLRFQV